MYQTYLTEQLVNEWWRPWRAAEDGCTVPVARKMPASNVNDAGQIIEGETRLKDDLRSKLHRSGVTNIRNRSEVGRGHIRAQHSEIYIVEAVECLNLTEPGKSRRIEDA
jgi:hypothetical protein